MYIFEDTLRLMETTAGKAIPWLVVCGARLRMDTQRLIAVLLHILAKKNALTFSGENDRYAETLDVDLSVGGWLEAELFIAPIGFDISNPKCKSSYAGSIDVEFSTNEGVDWAELDHFDAWKWRQESFFP